MTATVACSNLCEEPIVDVLDDAGLLVELPVVLDVQLRPAWQSMRGHQQAQSRPADLYMAKAPMTQAVKFGAQMRGSLQRNQIPDMLAVAPMYGAYQELHVNAAEMCHIYPRTVRLATAPLGRWCRPAAPRDIANLDAWPCVQRSSASAYELVAVGALLAGRGPQGEAMMPVWGSCGAEQLQALGVHSRHLPQECGPQGCGLLMTPRTAMVAGP